MGYEVHVVEVNDISNTTTSIRNYIQSSYENWSNPPEYVVLVGDTDGSYSIPYFSTTWGSSDYDYTLLEGMIYSLKCLLEEYLQTAPQI